MRARNVELANLVVVGILTGLGFASVFIARKDVVSYVQQLIDRDIAAPTLRDILTPIHQEFRASGMSEDELDALIEECREEVWQEKQARNGQ